ncbi:RGCVC family protein [Trujillonella endophytica]|uniref:Uncharacterized protein n=1 Tax=Trujillonella endophytica TaxID=673521 RepID=A0A1H8Q2Q2_9ACTN|nr:RGCVC family protein [Trujillella endophytica]SEO48525.1 hypothetical protein SAMN05660991_00539 [Trujillella endophytica]
MPALTAPAPTVPAPSAGPACGACPHPLAAHDAVGLRYCRATAISELDRGCVCRTA